ncbi:Uma2 family endonuclease [Clostridiaceae bacterium]|nr:Uma2 family endonuclease [Lachnospiraceae bacterium]NBH19117.1 Uma2 family endonuclease [Clostridiaceae bacterium]NBH35575.1 Uma2 family endonuclease [Clostridiaceae bacterium]
MEALRRKEYHTIEDIYALPDGERAELIDGQIYDMAPPSRTHQRISSYLHNEIYNHIKKNGGSCEVYAAPFAVFLNEDDTTYLEPDISVICDSSKLDERGCQGAPDWVIEIVSPGSKQMDYFKKLFLYRNAGVREYWIVDPTKKHVIVYKFEQEIMEQYSFWEDVAIGIFEDFRIRLAIFANE